MTGQAASNNGNGGGSGSTGSRSELTAQPINGRGFEVSPMADSNAQKQGASSMPQPWGGCSSSTSTSTSSTASQVPNYSDLGLLPLSVAQQRLHQQQQQQQEHIIASCADASHGFTDSEASRSSSMNTSSSNRGCNYSESEAKDEAHHYLRLDNLDQQCRGSSGSSVRGVSFELRCVC